MKAFSTLCALSLATLIAAPLAAQAADDCSASGHEQHQKASHADCGQHKGQEARPDKQGNPGEPRKERGEANRGAGKGPADQHASADKAQRQKPDAAHRPSPDNDDDNDDAED
ncbi:hypothetical protein [Azotobacter beijerinckii]|uniref:hypothetical protein n=1 Tax=Azotobacter beijerinckii TaxID=170623 RepID=UPI00295530E0|nr:hypothetical protein [Azotobacter beijerinckii]MDV7213495.1 hypothetical protein [Azotobacter beijerinckii]